MTEPLRTALLTRAYTLPINREPGETKIPKTSRDRPSRIDGRVLVFDTETNDDVSQSLLVATFGLFDGRHLEELGVVWADDLLPADRSTIED